MLDAAAGEAAECSMLQQCPTYRVSAGMPPEATTSTWAAWLLDKTASSAAESSLFAALWLLSRAMDTKAGMAPALATTAALRLSAMHSISRLASV